MVYDQLLAAGENWRARWVVVVGRRYIEDTLTTLNSFFLRHGMMHDPKLLRPHRLCRESGRDMAGPRHLPGRSSPGREYHLATAEGTQMNRSA